MSTNNEDNAALSTTSTTKTTKTTRRAKKTATPEPEVSVVTPTRTVSARVTEAEAQALEAYAKKAMAAFPGTRMRQSDVVKAAIDLFIAVHVTKTTKIVP